MIAGRASGPTRLVVEAVCIARYAIVIHDKRSNRGGWIALCNQQTLAGKIEGRKLAAQPKMGVSTSDGRRDIFAALDAAVDADGTYF